jgi:hypothetical protein
MTEPEISEAMLDAGAQALWRSEWAPPFTPPHAWDAMNAEEPETVEAYRVGARAVFEAMTAAQAEPAP